MRSRLLLRKPRKAAEMIDVALIFTDRLFVRVQETWTTCVYAVSRHSVLARLTSDVIRDRLPITFRKGSFFKLLNHESPSLWTIV